MIYKIENNLLICHIDSVGAEVRSLKNKVTGQEYIWPINPNIWASSAPVLFPAIGNIKENYITHNGKKYLLPKHGIVRNNSDLLFQQTNTHSCSFLLTSNKNTLVQYPFHFSFKVIFTLFKNSLRCTYEISNKDTQTMYFACGGHTAYKLDLKSLTQLSDYALKFPKLTQLKILNIGPNGLLTKKTNTIALLNNTLNLSQNLFDHDALVMADIACNYVILQNTKNNTKVTVKFKKFPHLALWAKPGADFICIEPWLGLPDSEDTSPEITKKTNLKSLKPTEKLSVSVKTIVK